MFDKVTEGVLCTSFMAKRFRNFWGKGTEKMCDKI